MSLRRIYPKVFNNIVFFTTDLSKLKVNVLEANNKKTKNLHQDIFLIVTSLLTIGMTGVGLRIFEKV